MRAFLVVLAVSAATPLDEVVSARAYSINEGLKADEEKRWCRDLVEKGEFCPSAGKPKALSAAQLKTALELLQTAPPSGVGSPGCWNPHHGIEFLDAGGNRIAFVAVSFQCQGVIRRGQEPEPLSDETQASWRALFKAVGLTKNLKTQ